MGHLHSIKCTKNKKGGEAYMVKHLLCKQRVAGSSPVFAFGSLARLVELADTVDLSSIPLWVSVQVRGRVILVKFIVIMQNTIKI